VIPYSDLKNPLHEPLSPPELRLNQQNIAKLSDDELIMLYKNSGEPYYAGILFQRFTPHLAVVTYKYLKKQADAEDALMEVFEIILKDLKTHQVGNFRAWAYSVTKHHCLKKIRAVNDKKFKPESALRQIADDTDYDFDPYLLDNQIEDLKKAISNLGPEQRICIDLFYLQEKSYKEVSDITGYPLNEVKSYLQNGKRNLKGFLTHTVHER
jgi:RNA polymerase sigma factor (sigma-70 family)